MSSRCFWIDLEAPDTPIETASAPLATFPSQVSASTGTIGQLQHRSDAICNTASQDWMERSKTDGHLGYWLWLAFVMLLSAAFTLSLLN